MHNLNNINTFYFFQCWHPPGALLSCMQFIWLESSEIVRFKNACFDPLVSHDFIGTKQVGNNPFDLARQSQNELYLVDYAITPKYY